MSTAKGERLKLLQDSRQPLYTVSNLAYATWPAACTRSECRGRPLATPECQDCMCMLLAACHMPPCARATRPRGRPTRGH